MRYRREKDLHRALNVLTDSLTVRKATSMIIIWPSNGRLGRLTDSCMDDKTDTLDV